MSTTTYYFGTSPDELLGDDPRFLYALRKNSDGELYFMRVDQLSATDSIQINSFGDDPAENYNDFEVGVDFFDGRDINHDLVYQNLNYEQWRWDKRSMLYFINPEGELVVRVNQGYNYPLPGDAN